MGETRRWVGADIITPPSESHPPSALPVSHKVVHQTSLCLTQGDREQCLPAHQHYRTCPQSFSCHRVNQQKHWTRTKSVLSLPASWFGCDHTSSSGTQGYGSVACSISASVPFSATAWTTGASDKLGWERTGLNARKHTVERGGTGAGIFFLPSASIRRYQWPKTTGACNRGWPWDGK